jgi:hypothetical protein
MNGMVASGTFDTTRGVEAVRLGVPIALAFGELGGGSFWSGRFKRNFGVEKGPYEVYVFVVFIRLEVNKE